jgi:hypothetical protein
LIHVLVRRGFDLEPRHYALISASTELAQLDAWLVRALGATELDAVFAED